MNNFYDKLNNIPIDKTSVKVTQFKGVHYKPNKVFNQPIWKDKPNIIKCPNKTLEKELIGLEFGKLKVIGFLGKLSKRKTKRPMGLWCVQCVCGNYEARKAKAIRNPNNNNDECQVCRRITEAKRHNEYLFLGFNKK